MHNPERVQPLLLLFYNTYRVLPLRRERVSSKALRKPDLDLGKVEDLYVLSTGLFNREWSV